MSKFYVSLIGPLCGTYFPLPEELDTEQRRRRALHSSRLAQLWHSIYPEDEVDRQIKEFGGTKLPDGFARRLDYKHNEVFR